MALLNCKKPDCMGQVDTELACQQVIALLGLKQMLETYSASFGLDQAVDYKQQLEYVNQQLSEFQIENLQLQFEQFKSYQKGGLNVGTTQGVRTLYIQCTEGHRNYYEVQCKP